MYCIILPVSWGLFLERPGFFTSRSTEHTNYVYGLLSPIFVPWSLVYLPNEPEKHGLNASLFPFVIIPYSHLETLSRDSLAGGAGRLG